MGRGIVGGYIDSFEAQGAAAADIALEILAGKDPATLPRQAKSPHKHMVDANALKRWGIAESAVPSGTMIQFKQPTLWDQYRAQAITALAVVFLQAALIAWLLFEHRRRRAVEEDLRHRVLEVLHLNRTASAGVMSASIAHELNQPLGAILLNTETVDMLLKDDHIDRKQIEEIVAEIRRDDERAASIIRGLTGFLKKKGTIELQRLDLNDAVQGALQIIEPVAVRRGFSVKADRVPVGLPVRADPVHLHQVIINLTFNAMDAMQDARRPRNVVIQTSRRSESEAMVLVSDNGTGIPEEKLTSIFETFYTTKKLGTGLGLSIARTIVELYGGKIWAENRPGGGATFTFTLPLVAARADERQEVRS